MSMEVVLDYKKVDGVLLRYISMDQSDLFKCVDFSNPPDGSVYNWVIPNIYKSKPKYSNYIGKGVYNEKFDFMPYANSRAINHINDPLYHAIQEAGPENCVCNIYVGITMEQAEACESLLLHLDQRNGMSYGQERWKGEPLINKRVEDVDMALLNKWFDLNGNNNIEAFRRKMYRY